MKKSENKNSSKKFRIMQRGGEFLSGFDFTIYNWILLTLFVTVIFAVGIINGEIELEQLMNEKMLSNLLFAIIFLIIMVNVCFHTDSVCFSRTVGLISGNILGYIILYLHESRLFLVSDNEITIIQVIGYYSSLLIMIRLIKWLLGYMIKRERGGSFHAFCSIEDVVYDITFDMRDDKKYHISDVKES